ncbi:hypothetical protein HDU93_000850 [Gonapodya sp. JEL0774]|nr:hypothetical protein HDU93_000850 [Gonapodya sp. JEL0774]
MSNVCQAKGSAKIRPDATIFSYFTAPSGPLSINNDADGAASATHCLPVLRPILADHDAFLVACYSAHPLVPLLQREPVVLDGKKPVTGIMEASVDASLMSLGPGEAFGVVSTGRIWEELLAKGIAEHLGVSRDSSGVASSRFAGVETTGLNANELHDAPAELVRKRMKEATARLLRRGKVGAVCLGCAGMAGLDDLVREACVEEMGEEAGKRVKIVDEPDLSPFNYNPPNIIPPGPELGAIGEQLMQKHHSLPSPISSPALQQPLSSSSTFLGMQLKWISLLILVVQNSMLVIVMKYARMQPGQKFLSSTAKALDTGNEIWSAFQPSTVLRLGVGNVDKQLQGGVAGTAMSSMVARQTARDSSKEICARAVEHGINHGLEHYGSNANGNVD